MRTVEEKTYELCEEAGSIIIPMISKGEEPDEETKEKIRKKYDILTKIGRLVYMDYQQNRTITFEGERLLR